MILNVRCMRLEIGAIVQSKEFAKTVKGGLFGHNPFKVNFTTAVNHVKEKDLNLSDKARGEALFIIEHIESGDEGPSTEFYARRTYKNGGYNPKGELLTFDAESSCSIASIDSSEIKVLGRIKRGSRDYKLLSEQIMTRYLGF